MKNIVYLLLLCTVAVQARRIFDLKGFLQNVIKSNLNKNKYKIGQIKIGCDEYDWCSAYKSYCYHPTVKTYCKGTCGTCPTAPPKVKCEDKFDCSNFKKYCFQDRYKNYMKENCAKTCGVCGEGLSCGVAKRRSNTKTNIIVGGETARKGFYPWQVAIYYEDEYLCGGSLVTNKHVLTAAHCFKHLSKDFSLYKVVLGDHNRDVNEGTEVERGVKKIEQHESYQYEADTHDLAIMELDSTVVFGDDINAICLPKQDEILPTGSKCFMSGWGKIRNDGEAVNFLQHLALPIADRNHCKERNTFNQHVVNDRMICAGYDDGLNYGSGCHGDSGGPLACEQPDGSFKLYGVVSWGSPQCSGLDRYTVFSRVSKYTSWIKQKTSS